MSETELTDEERALLSLYDFMAFMMHVEILKKNGTTALCWLAMSDEARKGVREDFFARMAFEHLKHHDEALTQDRLNDLIENQREHWTPFIQQWVDAETEMKQQRADGNPKAFFADWR